MASSSVATTWSGHRTDAAESAAAPDRRLGWWDTLTFHAAHGVVRILLRCLSLNGLYHFGRALGTLEWLVNHHRRRRFAAAYARILGHPSAPRDRRRATREFFMQTRCDKLFYLVFDCIPPDKALTLLTIGQKHLLDESVADQRGAYLALSHHGALHVVALLMALCGYKTAGVRDRREGALRRFVQDRFERRYPRFRKMRVIYADAYPREIYRCLREGYLLGSAMDVTRVRRPNQKTEELEIFGEKRLFLSGPLRVARRCGAAVLQAFIIPKKGFRYRLDIVERLYDPESVEEEAALVQRVMPRYAANVEAYLRAHPALLTRI